MNKYKSEKWKKKRESILKRDNYLCKECHRFGKSVSANTVHHINPAEDYPDLFLSDENLISLCNSCHNEMHDRNTNHLTKKGQDLKNRTLIRAS